MSVQKSKRTESDLRVIDTAENIAKYILKLTRNEKYFSKRTRWQLANKLIETSLNIVENTRVANDLKLDVKITADKRYLLQDIAYGKSNYLLSLINISIINIPIKKIRTLVNLVMQYQVLLRAWQKSDKERLNKILCENNNQKTE